MLTINQMVSMAYETAVNNGWHEDKGELVSPSHPQVQIAALSLVANALAWVVEAIRSPSVGKQREQTLSAVARNLATEGRLFYVFGPFGTAEQVLRKLDETGRPLKGSKAQALAWLRLIDSETAEATRAVMNEDDANLAEELADIVIRVGDFVGAWNELHPDRRIDLEAAILTKNEKNRRRGYHHGGKLA